MNKEYNDHWMHDVRHIKKSLLSKVYEQMECLDHINAEELGEVIDAIKDCYEMCKLEHEAKYYHTIVKAMEAKDEPEARIIYMPTYPMYQHNEDMEKYENKRKIYKDSYMEAKAMHKDKATSLGELEKYMRELTSDITGMLAQAAPDEKQYVEKHMQALLNKISG